MEILPYEAILYTIILQDYQILRIDCKHFIQILLEIVIPPWDSMHDMTLLAEIIISSSERILGQTSQTQAQTSSISETGYSEIVEVSGSGRRTLSQSFTSV
jgi:hypothetical protein